MSRIAAKTAKVLPRTWSPNQVVAHNLTRARLLRGWTQDQAAEALAPYLGSRLSLASFSAIERSIAGTRVKQFTADELVALSRAFDLPLGWWFTPPVEGAMHTPDHPRTGVDFDALVDVVLGTPDTLPAWTDALEQWAAGRARTGDTRRTGAHHAKQIELRARALVRERLGDISAARDVLRRIADLLGELDEPAPSGMEPASEGASGTATTSAGAKAGRRRPPKAASAGRAGLSADSKLGASAPPVGVPSLCGSGPGHQHATETYSDRVARLAAQQGLRSLEDARDLAADIWESDEELDEFLRDVRRSRNASLA